MIRASLKKVAASLFKDYELYRIYKSGAGSPINLPQGFTFHPCETAAPLATATDADVRRIATYLNPESKLFAISKDGRVVAACAYWWGEEYKKTRHIWKLNPGEAKLVQITTDAGQRGLGIATSLIALSAKYMNDAGFNPLYARIWRSNAASVRAFIKAGWTYRAFVVRITFHNGRAIRLQLPPL